MCSKPGKGRHGTSHHDRKLSICNVAYHFKVNCIVNNSLKVFIHFSEEIVSKLIQKRIVQVLLHFQQSNCL
jgi:hypothetical protein